MSEFLELHYRPQSYERDLEICNKVIQVSKILPDSLKALEFVTKLSNNLLTNPEMLSLLSKLVRPDVMCEDSVRLTVSP